MTKSSLSFGQILKHFKETESPENIVPLTDCPDLRNGVVAWKSVVITFTDSEPCEETVESLQWNWMWSKVKFDIGGFATVAGVNPQNAGKLFERLRGLRLIYPDGTINDYAAKYLQAIIMSKIPKPKK